MFCDGSDHLQGAGGAGSDLSTPRRYPAALFLLVLFAACGFSVKMSCAEEPLPVAEQKPQAEPQPAQEQPSPPEQRPTHPQPAGIVSRIPHQPVESRALASVGYSTRLRALEITFKRGGTYRYLDVPRSVYREMLAAESKARFYNKNVRAKYRSVYVRPRKR